MKEQCQACPALNSLQLGLCLLTGQAGAFDFQGLGPWGFKRLFGLIWVYRV